MWLLSRILTESCIRSRPVPIQVREPLAVWLAPSRLKVATRRLATGILRPLTMAVVSLREGCCSSAREGWIPSNPRAANKRAQTDNLDLVMAERVEAVGAVGTAF